MLVLTRKQMEQIVLGDNIVITVLAVNGNSVRLGIQAPRIMKVVRGELVGVDVAAAIALVEQSDAITETKDGAPEQS